MNWYKKANLWDDIKKYGPKSNEPIDINDPKIEWLSKRYKQPKEKIIDILKNTNRRLVSDYYEKDYFTNQYGWSVPTQEAINDLKEFVGSDTVLEVGSGHGMWAKLMQEAQINVRATDYLSGKGSKVYLGRERDKFFTDIEDISGKEAVQKYNTNIIMMSWPPCDDPLAFDVLSIFKGNKLIFVGEGKGGCTANSDFFQLLDKNWTLVKEIDIPKWAGIHDRLYLYERK
jgi:hypothetical protein